MAYEGSVAGRLYQLQQRLKQEKLFVNKEKAAIFNLNTDIVSTSERLYHLSWITRQQWKIVQRKWASPEECSQVVNRLDSARFVDASTHLGYLESKYWDFLRSVRENSTLVASALAYADRINFDTSLLIRLMLNSLYGNCLLPEDENYVLLLMKHLMELKTTGEENPEVFFQYHRNSFTSLFEILVDSLFSTKLYLTAALHAPIMQVLSEDALFIKRLPRQCMKFVENLEAKLYCFPQSLRWLICQFHNILSTCQKFTEKKARSMILKLLFDFLICPAILRPHQFGITSDVQISEIASQNLQQISSCLHSSCSSEGDSPRAVDLFSRIDQACITSFLDAVLEEQKYMCLPDSPAKQFLPGLCRNSVLITENELHALTSFFRMIEHSEDSGELVDLKELKELLDKLPPPSDPPEVPDPTSQDGGTPVSKGDLPSESPKTSKNKRQLKKKDKDKSSKHQAEMQVEKVAEIKVVKQLNPFAVVNRSDEFKDDCIKRLSTMFQDDEDVLIISLGYSAIECPGMLAEEKVLGISKPIKEVGPGGSFRPRSSSSSFYKKIFNDKSAMKEEIKRSFDDEEEEEEESEQQNTESEEQSFFQLRSESQSSSHLDGSNIPETAATTSEMDLLDLVQGAGVGVASQDVEQGDRSTDRPSDIDVLGGHSISATPWPDKPGHSNSTDLIDFGVEFPQPVLTASRERSHSCSTAEVQNLIHLNSPPTVAPHTLFSSQDSGNRDSAISTGSSTRYSVSSVSTRSSGLEFSKDSFVGDSAYDDNFIIPEEQSQFDTCRLENRETCEVDRLKRSSLLVVGARRYSKVSNRDSTSSGTITGFASEGSNRDSQASFQGFDVEFPPRTSSSSTADEEQEAENSKRPSRAASLKKQWERMKKKDKSEGKERRKDSLTDSFEFGVQSQKKDKGLRKFIKGTSTPKALKKSGAKVYERLADQTVEAFNIAKVDEKTPKDIENIIEKYTALATNRALAQSGSTASNESDDDEDDEENDDFIDEHEKFDNAKRKLRLVLSQACTENFPWLLANGRMAERRSVSKSLGQELMTFLHVQLAEAIHLQDRALSAQLHETIRSVRELPVISYSKLLFTLEEEYKARTPYLSYLIKAHQGLLATQAHLERLVDRVERDKIICRDYFTMMCVGLFLESKEKGEINKFCSEFQSLPIPDEKNLLLERFLENLADKMESHPIWSGVSQEQLQVTFVATERAIMSNVYKIAFYPNGEIDMDTDRKFHEHVTNLQKVVNLNHKAVRVPKMYRKEAPWESAQNELLKINAYKTPTDKLKCVKRCCATIMNLLCLASETSVPGADEFVPALVYVVIHANPLGLLSTVKYVTTFYDKRLSGEEAYYWMQFCAAIAFIKTLS